MKRSRVCLLVVVISISAAVSGTVHAQWIKNGTAITNIEMDQSNPRAVTDGSGGAFIVWKHYGHTSAWDIYAQRIDSYGRSLWAPEGVVVCEAPNEQEQHRVALDGMGGIVVTWRDYRNGSDEDIFAQRLDGGGTTLWTSDGDTVCAAANVQSEPRIIGNDAGGAYIVWEDQRGASGDIYIQHMNASGVAQWTYDGVPTCTTAYNQSDPALASDGMGGVIVVWSDGRKGTEWDIWGQYYGPSGNTLWGPWNGLELIDATGDQIRPLITPDGTGGVFMAWLDDRGTDRDIYAQRFDNSANEWWTANGLAICTATDVQESHDLAGDIDDGSVVITWRDYRNGFLDTDIFAQKVDLYGTVQWAADGAAVCSAPNNQDGPRIACDGAGGAIVTWYDSRTSAEPDIYAQRIESAGSPVWTSDGEPMCRYLLYQQLPVIVTDGAGGAIIAWRDNRYPSNWDVYAQRVTHDGLWGYPSPFIHSIRDVPGDEGGLVNVTWDASRLDVPPGDISVYTVWRAIDATAAASMAEGGARLLELVELSRLDIAGPVVLADGSFYWEQVATVDAHQLSHYAKAVPTLFDSTSGTDKNHYFQVIAHGMAGGLWVSPPDSGRSVDNLAPAAPLTLAAQRAGSDVELEWHPSGEDEADFLHYAVYRAETSGFSPSPSYFLTTTPDTTLVDTDADPAQRFYYLVTSIDTHENESDPSNEAMADVVTGVDDRVPEVRVFTVLPNSPNPFGTTTEIRFGLPRAGDVVLRVYDIAGRRVFEKRVGALPAGWRSIRFDGRDGDGRLLPSGVYPYRLSAAGETQTRKMVITR
jgi:hypothetical protein